MRGNEAVAGEIGAGGARGSAGARLADLQERIGAAEKRAAEIGEEILTLGQAQVTQEEVEHALEAFEPVWDALAPREQARIVQLIVERVDFDGNNDQVSVTFHPTGIRTLADEIAGRSQEKSE